MPKEDLLEFDGEVIETLPGLMYRVQLDDVEHIVLAQMNGRMRKNRIRVLEGDRVRVETSTYDLNRGRINHRY
jgi:translation initiation factor IF-1